MRGQLTKSRDHILLCHNVIRDQTLYRDRLPHNGVAASQPTLIVWALRGRTAPARPARGE